MSSPGLSLIAFVFIFGGAIVGMILRRALPDNHLRDDSRDVIKLATGLVGTISALVLGLLVASAKGFYDGQTTEITHISANIVFLDLALARYGPETKEAREALCNTTEIILDQSGSKDGARAYRLDPTSIGGGVLYDKIQALNPSDDLQRSIKSQALSMAVNIGQMRMLMYEQGTLSVSKPLLAIMVFWLTVTFVIWGLLAPPNGTVIAVMLASALSASGAILLILEMYSPYEGFIRVSDAPLRAALAYLGH
ncbi:hypothetical protein BDD14_1600 [Edaphobacter modestus]|uniref:DUF4239 domain-containing protein n=1 Tax=Edaphobacter modestus TaxID=388466 RepID=A0A4V2G4A7_9BACT|nr:hypothetical protein BDD14_1600 [Edaphobacter modestus]